MNQTLQLFEQTVAKKSQLTNQEGNDSRIGQINQRALRKDLARVAAENKSN